MTVTATGGEAVQEAVGDPVLPFREAVVPISFIAGIFFLNFTSRIILAPLLVTVEQDLGLSHAEAGGLFMLISIGYAVGLLASGFVSSRISHRHTIILSALALGSVLVGISLTETVAGIRIGCVVLGLAASLYLPSGLTTLTSFVAPTDWGKAIAVHEVAPIMAFITAPILAESISRFFSWRGTFLFLGVALLVMGLAYARYGTGGRFNGSAPRLSVVRGLLDQPAFWIVAVFLVLGVAGEMGVYHMLPLYLTSERGLEREWANTLLGLSRIPGLLMVFLAGWITDRLGVIRSIGVFMLGMGMLTVAIGGAPDSWLVWLVIAQPMMAVSFFPAGLAAMSRIGPPASRNVVVSLMAPLATLIGSGVVPAVLGLLADHDHFSLGYGLLGLVIVASVIQLVYLKFPEDQTKPAGG